MKKPVCSDAGADWFFCRSILYHIIVVIFIASRFPSMQVQRDQQDEHEQKVINGALDPIAGIHIKDDGEREWEQQGNPDDVLQGCTCLQTKFGSNDITNPAGNEEPAARPLRKGCNRCSFGEMAKPEAMAHRK